MTDFLFPTAFSSWRPYDGSPEWAAYEQVLRSGRLTMAGETAAFEEEIAAYHGRRHAIAVNSGSSANLVAVAALNARYRFDQIVMPTAIIPAIAWATTYAPLIQYNVDLRIGDVGDDWNAVPLELTSPPCPNHFVVACSILGCPADLPGWRRAVDRRSANIWSGLGVLFEDNCESLGARTADGRLTGTFGDLSTGSGFFSHQLSAVELGWILTDDDELARLCRLLRNHGNDGWGSDDFDRSYNLIANQGEDQ